MATKRFPQRNVVMPMDPEHVAAARARLDVGRQSPNSGFIPADGKGSRREVRKGEWIDDRVLHHGRPQTPWPTMQSAPPAPEQKELPASYDPAMVYDVKLGSAVPYLGRILNPGKSYAINGAVCALPTIQPAIIDAVLIGPIPVPTPPTPPVRSAAKKA
jgi:hypothetical protein